MTGPDEYTTVVDNNAYTNLMAKENLEVADARDRVAAGRRPGRRTPRSCRATGLERRRGRRLAPRRRADVRPAPRASSGIVLQDEHFLERKRWDFEATPPEKHPLLLHYHPLELYRHQVIKQTDVVLATYLVGQHFSEEEKRRTFDYYDPLTTGDSTLSACVQSVIASEVGYAEAALDYFLDACAVDLLDLARQHRGRHPHRLLRRHLARARRRLRRPARLRRRGALQPAAPGRVGRACASACRCAAS